MARTPKIVEDRRAQILDAAVRTFSQKGFTRTTNKDIAREAGITPGLIYHYFDSKEALLRAIIEARSPVQILHSLPEDMLTMPPRTFLSWLLQRALTIVENEEFVRLIRVFLPEIIHNPEMPPVARNIMQQVTDFMTDYLTAKMQSGELRQSDASLAAQVLLGSIVGFVIRRQIFRDPGALLLSQEEVANGVVNTVLQGLLPS